MQLDPSVTRLVVSVLAGMIAGGLTNHVAVWMLFHPYTRKLGIQGAIPRNKERLAKRLGKTVGERLLTPDDIMAELSDAGVRATFEVKLREFVEEMLTTERGALREVLSASAAAGVDQIVTEVADAITARITTFAAGDGFEKWITAEIPALRARFADKTVADILPAEQAERLMSQAANWGNALVQSAELESAIRERISAHVDGLMNSDEPTASRIPPAILTGLHGAIDSYLPLAATRVSSLLADPGARARIRAALRSLFDKMVRDLELHQRIIARLLVTERTLDRALDTLELEGADQIAALLNDSAMRGEITAVLRDGISAFLARPPREILGHPDKERISAFVDTATGYVVRVLRSGSTGETINDLVRKLLFDARGRTIGHLTAGLTDAQAAAAIARIARAPRTTDVVGSAIRGSLRSALSLRIGRAGDWLPPDAARRIADSAAPVVWGWLVEQLPAAIRTLDIEAMVERKVNGFSIQRMEEIIRSVTERELRLIVRLGYLLGGMIGAATWAISLFLN